MQLLLSCNAPKKPLVMEVYAFYYSTGQVNVEYEEKYAWQLY